MRHSRNLTRCERGPSRLPRDSERNITNTLGNRAGKEAKGNGSRSFKSDQVDDWRDAGPKATRFRWAIRAATIARRVVRRYEPAYADFSGRLRKTYVARLPWTKGDSESNKKLPRMVFTTPMTPISSSVWLLRSGVEDGACCREMERRGWQHRFPAAGLTPVIFTIPYTTRCPSYVRSSAKLTRLAVASGLPFVVTPQDDIHSYITLQQCVLMWETTPNVPSDFYSSRLP